MTNSNKFKGVIKISKVMRVGRLPDQAGVSERRGRDTRDVYVLRKGHVH